MSDYNVSFFKYLLSSDGHPFKCFQKSVHIRSAKSTERAVRAAQRRYERLNRIPRWDLHADLFEVAIDGRKIDACSDRLPIRRWSDRRRHRSDHR